MHFYLRKIVLLFNSSIYQKFLNFQTFLGVIKFFDLGCGHELDSILFGPSESSGPYYTRGFLPNEHHFPIRKHFEIPAKSEVPKKRNFIEISL